jgi:glycerol-3-phosphate dehydrogenase
MAEDTIDKAIVVGGLNNNPCCTQNLRLHGYEAGQHLVDSWLAYGSERHSLEKLLLESPEMVMQLHPRLPYHRVEIIWAVRYEMARTLEDALARRTRSLFLDAQASMEMAPLVASIMAKELNRPSSWEQSQIKQFNKVAKEYLL